MTGNRPIKLQRPWWKDLWCELAHGHATVVYSARRAVRICYDEAICIGDSDGEWLGRSMEEF